MIFLKQHVYPEASAAFFVVCFNLFCLSNLYWSLLHGFESGQ